MKYNRDSVVSAIFLLMPELEKAKNMGATMLPLLDMIDTTAKHYFMPCNINGNNFRFKLTYNQRIAMSIIAEAIHELQTIGYFEFGNKQWEPVKG